MSKVIVKNVKVEIAPGFKNLEGPALKDFENGLNIIYGTNGSGKTTISKALQASLWENKGIEKFQVETEAKLDNNDWKLIRKRNVLEQKNLQTNRIEKLLNRKDEYAANYNFSIIDLLESDAKPLKEKINKELNFGIDFDKIKNSLDLLKKEKLGTSVSKKYKDLSDNLEKAKNEIEEAQTLRQEREELKEKIQEFDEKIKKAGNLTDKIEIKKKMLEKERLELKLESYPSYMKYLSEDHLRSFKKDEDNLSKNKTNLKDAENEIKDCILELEKTGFLNKNVKEDSYDNYLSAKLNQLDTLENNYNDCLKNQELKKEELSRWLESNKFFIDSFSAENLNEASIVKLSTLERDYEKKSSEKESRKILLDLFGKKEEGIEKKVENLFSSIKEEVSSKNRPLIYILYVFVLGFGFVTALVSPWFSLGIVACIIALFIKNQNKIDYSELKEKIIQLIELRKIEEKNDLIEKADKEYAQKTDALEAWLKEWEKTCGELALNTMQNSFSSSKFYDYGNVLKQGIALKESLEKSKDEFNFAKEKLKEFKEEVTKELKINCLDFDFLALENKLKKEKDNFTNYLKQKSKKVNIEKDFNRLTEEIEQDTKLVEAFWEETGLQPNEKYQIEVYRSKYDTFINEKFSYDTLTKDLENQENLVIELNEISLETLQSQKEEIDDLQKRKEELISEEGKKAAKYENAIKNDDYKNTLKELDEEKERLKELREVELEKIFCRQICEEVENSNVKNNQPMIINKANEWLTKITKQTFELFYNKDFFVRDINKNENYTFDQLSSGTRVQVLLSLRLGALEVLEEQGASYPLFFDETLANSDDERSSSISQALYELSKQRQVFYFTAQSEEVNKLKQQYKGDFEKVGYFDLDVEKKEQKQRLRPYKGFKEKKKIEFPSNYEDCPNVLKLSKPNLFEDITDLSIFYVFNEVKDLDYYYNLGVKKIGQLKVISNPEIQEIIKALEKAQKLAKRGRCRTLHKENLEDTQIEGINTGANYWADILEQVSSSNSGKDLVAQMENGVIKRLNPDKIENIKNYLREEDFFTEEKSLDEAEVLLLTLERIKPENYEQIQKVINRYLGMVLDV